MYFTVNSDLLLYILIGIGVLFLIFVLSMVFRTRKYKYEKTPLFTKAEAHFYKSVLLPIEAKSDIRFFGKIRVADIVKPHHSLSKKERSRHFWRTSSKHIDFVAIDKNTLKTLGCVELNDSSHKLRKRKARDKMIDKIMESADIPMLWVAWQKSYDNKVRNHIYKRLKENISD